MKLKKILSGFLAAAMAVTTMVTASVTAGAEGETTIWTGSVDCGTSWSVAEDVDGFAGAKAGDVLKITCSAVGSESYHQIMLKDSSWNNFEAGALTATAGAASCMQLSEADAAAVNSGFKISGYDCTVTKIEHLPVAAAAETIWAGSVDCGTSWSVAEDVDGFAAAKAGDVLKITCSAVGSESYHQIMLKDSSWNNFEAGALTATAGAASCMQLSEADAAAVNSGFKISGYDCTVTKIEYLKVGVAAHTITIDPAIENGTVTSDKTEAAKDDKVTLTVTPAEGYELDTLTVATSTAGTDTVTVAADNTFTMPDADVTVTATFKTAEVALTGITLDKKTAALLVGNTTTLTVTKVPADTTDETAITWASDTPAVATVSASGVVTGVKAGTATITATCGTKTAACTVTVTEDATPCTGVTLNKTTAQVMKGATVTLTATTTPEDTTDEITWASSDASIATVKDGVVTGKARGTANITVTCGDQTATCKVSVNEEETISGTTPKVFKSAVTDGKYNENDVFVISAADVAAAKSVTITVTDNNGKKTTKDVTECYKKVTYTAADGTTDTITSGANYLLAVTVTGIPSDKTVTVTITVNK